jgi:hypothetical protein
VNQYHAKGAIAYQDLMMNGAIAAYDKEVGDQAISESIHTLTFHFYPSRSPTVNTICPNDPSSTLGGLFIDVPVVKRLRGSS